MTDSGERSEHRQDTAVRVLAGLAAFAIFAFAPRFCIGLGVLYVVAMCVEHAIIPE